MKEGQFFQTHFPRSQYHLSQGNPKFQIFLCWIIAFLAVWFEIFFILYSQFTFFPIFYLFLNTIKHMKIIVSPSISLLTSQPVCEITTLSKYHFLSTVFEIFGFWNISGILRIFLFFIPLFGKGIVIHRFWKKYPPISTQTFELFLACCNFTSSIPKNLENSVFKQQWQ